MIIIYTFAIIGGFTVIGLVGLIILLLAGKSRKDPVCCLTDEPCPNTDATTGSCKDCPIAVQFFESAEKGERWT